MTKIPLGVECKFYGCDMHTYDILLRLHIGGNYGTEEVYEDRMVVDDRGSTNGFLSPIYD